MKVERDNVIYLDGYLTMVWLDKGLVWKSIFPYNCSESLVVNIDDIWAPDLTWLQGSLKKCFI